MRRTLLNYCKVLPKILLLTDKQKMWKPLIRIAKSEDTAMMLQQLYAFDFSSKPVDSVQLDISIGEFEHVLAA